MIIQVYQETFLTSPGRNVWTLQHRNVCQFLIGKRDDEHKLTKGNFELVMVEMSGHHGTYQVSNKGEEDGFH